MKDVFMKCLKPIGRMMRQQLALAKESKLEVEVCTHLTLIRCSSAAIVLNIPQKVLLIGGFAGSPSLRNYLSHVLAKLENIDGKRKSLKIPTVP